MALAKTKPGDRPMTTLYSVRTRSSHSDGGDKSDAHALRHTHARHMHVGVQMHTCTCINKSEYAHACNKCTCMCTDACGPGQDSRRRRMINMHENVKLVTTLHYTLRIKIAHLLALSRERPVKITHSFYKKACIKSQGETGIKSSHLVTTEKQGVEKDRAPARCDVHTCYSPSSSALLKWDAFTFITARRLRDIARWHARASRRINTHAAATDKDDS